MLISGRNIYTVNRVRRQLRWANREDRGHLQLTEFTLSTQAQLDSEQNLRELMALARLHDARYLIFSEWRFQVLLDHRGDADRLYRYLQHQASEPLDLGDGTTNEPKSNVYQQRSDEDGLSITFTYYRRCLTSIKNQGMYECDTDQRITNRRNQIQRLWDLGFAAQRGRPLWAAPLTKSGNRRDLETLTSMATDTKSLKIRQTYNSINRECAWPGSW